MSDLKQAVKYAKQAKHWVQEADRLSSSFHIGLALRKLNIAKRHADGEEVPEIMEAWEAGNVVLIRLNAEAAEAANAE